jgi:serine/threonine protein kinase
MGPTCFGRYILLERIASGGMGEVFIAVPRTLWGFDKFFAVKKILPALSQEPEFLSRFRDEARLVIPMNHPNVVQVYEVGRVEESYFIAMELVEGCNVGQLLSRCWQYRHRQALPIPAALLIIRELLAGLEYCHRRTDSQGGNLGLVHRDVSPSNVLVSYDGAVKLADFGLALSSIKVVHTKPNHVLGHLGYIAPEGLDGHRLDARADIFSAGVLLFELLTCQRFAPGSDPIAVRQQLLTRGQVRPSALRPEIPAEVDNVAMRAVAANPQDRYPTAQMFHDEVQRALVHLDAVYGARQLSHNVMHTLFDPQRKRQQLMALARGLDLDELEASHPAGRTVCLGEAIPLGSPPDLAADAEAPRRTFGTGKAVLTLIDDMFEGDTEPVRLSGAHEVELPEVRSSSCPRRSRRREWRTPAPVRSGGSEPKRRPRFLKVRTNH